MAKNLSRKAIALGASFALVSAGLISTPASAAVGIALDSNGTSGVYGAVEAQAFTFTANGNTEFPVGNAGLLRVQIKNISGSTASAFKINGTTLDADFATGDGNAIRHANGTTFTVATLGTTAGDTAVMGLGVTDADGDADSVSAMTSPFTFSFTSTAVDDTPGKYEVTVFADTNNNGVLNTGELASDTRTVTFYDLADVTGTVTLAALTEGDTTVSGTMVFQNIDMAQMAATDVGVFLEAGDGTKIGGDSDGAVLVDLILEGATSTNGTAGVVEWDSTNKYFEFTTAALGTDISGLEAALVKATYVKAHALHDSIGGGAPAAADKRSTATSALVATRATGSLQADTVTSATAADATAGTSVTEDVALNSSYSVRAIVKDTATVAKAISGAAVAAKVTVSGATLSSTVTVSINGTTYTSAAALPGATGVAKLALTTNSSGEAIVNITTVGFANGNDVVVEFTAENRTATITTNNETKSYSAYVVGAIDGVTTKDGTAAVVNVAVRDQFYGVPANGTYRVVSDWVSSSQTTAATAASESLADVVNGNAALSILDNGTGDGTNVYDIDLKTLATDGSYSATASVIDNFEVQISANAVGSVVITDGGSSVVTQNATTKVYTDAMTAGDGNNGELLLEDFVAHNPLSVFTAPTDVTAATGATITGTTKTLGTATAASAAVAGANVTLSAPGVLFRYTADGSIDIYAVGSITVPSDKSGNFTVKAWSNKSGKQTVTVTSNGASATLVLDKFDAAAATTGTSLTIDAPSYVSPGSTLVIKGLLVDDYGNVVDTTAADRIKVSYTGPGLQVGSTPTAYTEGVAQLGYFLGSNDKGTISVTFSYNADGTDDVFTGDDDLTVTKTITIGTAPAAAKVNVGSFNGKLVVYANGYNGKKISWKVGGKWGTAVAASDTARFARVTPRKGVTVSVQIYVDGVLTLTKSVVTK